MNGEARTGEKGREGKGRGRATCHPEGSQGQTKGRGPRRKKCPCSRTQSRGIWRVGLPGGWGGDADAEGVARKAKAPRGKRRPEVRPRARRLGGTGLRPPGKLVRAIAEPGTAAPEPSTPFCANSRRKVSCPPCPSRRGRLAFALATSGRASAPIPEPQSPRLGWLGRSWDAVTALTAAGNHARKDPVALCITLFHLRPAGC